jgi:protease YdgD
MLEAVWRTMTDDGKGDGPMIGKGDEFFRLISRLAIAFGACWLIAAGLAGPAAAVPFKPLPAPAGPRSVVPVAVFGSDERTKLPTPLKSLRNSIGLIYNGDVKTVCSAFCVHDNIVATASHCIYRTKGKRAPPANKFVFSRPGTGLPSSRVAGARAKAAAQQIIAGAVGISTKPPIDAALDWALVKLELPVCRGHALKLLALPQRQVAKEAAADHVFQVAFHRDFGNWTIAHGRNCRVQTSKRGLDGYGANRDFRNPRDLILHGCDTGGASSGSPIFVSTPRGPRVVAINVGTFVRSRVLVFKQRRKRKVFSSPIANTAVSVAAFADRLEVLKSAEILTATEDLLRMQDTLAIMRLYSGPLDGIYGSKMRRAISAYEQKSGSLVTGLPTSALMNKLRSGSVGSERVLRPTSARSRRSGRR